MEDGLKDFVISLPYPLSRIGSSPGERVIARCVRLKALKSGFTHDLPNCEEHKESDQIRRMLKLLQEIPGRTACESHTLYILLLPQADLLPNDVAGPGGASTRGRARKRNWDATT
jgi:hypothetical protein